MPEKTDSEVTRITNMLSSAIKFSGWKQRDIEKTLGWSSGSMSRLLSGGIELKIKHVLEICSVIGFPPARFFHATYPDAEQGGQDAARLQRLLEQLHPLSEPEAAAPMPPEPPTPALDQAEVERMVYGALAKFFSNMGGKTSP
jgi:transcriptional regulator with XRE-family HTH domain